MSRGSQTRSFAVLIALGALAAGCGTDTVSAPAGPPPTKAQAARALRTLKAQANRLLSGSPSSFRARLAGLRGHPVVVNQWASWCGPCRFEFPFFRRLANKYYGRVAFLGVDSQDARSDAEKFLKELPVPYPSYYDKDASIARVFRGGVAWPTTAFFNARGKLTQTHLGAYASQAKLDQDIRRYAIRG